MFSERETMGSSLERERERGEGGEREEDDEFLPMRVLNREATTEGP